MDQSVKDILYVIGAVGGISGVVAVIRFAVKNIMDREIPSIKKSIARLEDKCETAKVQCAGEFHPSEIWIQEKIDRSSTTIRHEICAELKHMKTSIDGISDVIDKINKQKNISRENGEWFQKTMIDIVGKIGIEPRKLPKG